MRIIAGKYRGRHFDVPHTFKARPTTDFAKENLFNVLQAYFPPADDDDKPFGRALDLFAGTGSITLELLSRGCEAVTAVELDPQHVRFIRSFIHALGEDKCARVLRADALRFIARPRDTYDFIFADPPYALPQLSQLPNAILAASGLLAPDGLLVLEHGADNDFSAHPALVDHRTYGSVNFSFFKS